MKADILVRWVDALRSGQYQQCKGKLHDGVGYCCLGVLTQVYLDEHQQDWYRLTVEPGEGTPGEAFLVYEVSGQSAVLPTPVMHWAGISQANPVTEKTGLTLAMRNDAGFTFNEIANSIEEEGVS